MAVIKVLDSTTSVDGRIIPNNQANISLINASVDYACSSVFEGMRCNYNEKTKEYAIFRLEDHVNRFFNSVQIEKINFSFSKEEVKNAIVMTCEDHVNKYGDNGGKSIYIRPKTFLDDG